MTTNEAIQTLPLTDRQKTILMLLCEGRTGRGICKFLGLSSNGTIHSHLDRAASRLGCRKQELKAYVLNLTLPKEEQDEADSELQVHSSRQQEDHLGAGVHQGASEEGVEGEVRG